MSNFQLPWGKTVEGKEAMRQTYLRIFAAFPDIQVDIERLSEDGPRVAVEWRFRGTMLGEFAGHPPNHRTFDMRGCEVFEVKDGKAGAVSFESVPAFLFARDKSVGLPGFGEIGFDIAYGGAFYALADCRQFGLEFGKSRVRDFVDAATALTRKLKAEFPLSHPDHDDLAFLYGTILTDGGDGANGRPTKNICVFADAEVDRSPTGSGVPARLAAMHARGEIAIGETRLFESVAGSRFTGAVARETTAGPHAAIVARVGGRAFYSGKAEFTLEPDDELGRGFLLR